MTRSQTARRAPVEGAEAPPTRLQVFIRAGSVPVVLVGMSLVVAGLAIASPARAPVLLLLAGAAVAAAVWGLLDPVVAAAGVLVLAFVRQATPNGLLPVEPFLLSFAGLLVSVFLWTRARGPGRVRVGSLDVLIALYVLWNAVSLLVPHDYEAIFPLGGTALDTGRFVAVGVVVPLAALLVGIAALGHERGLRMLMGAAMVFAGYSAYVSIMQFYGPASLVWPRYVVDSPGWPGRAVGLANQPVVNGMLLILGYVAFVVVGSRTSLRPVLRWGCVAMAAACCVGIYLTHTRVVWLGFAVVVAAGVALARGWRSWFVVTSASMLVGVTATWARFTSDDRSAGGVGSAGEVHDRLNMIATSWWAIERMPWAGWGIGRFPVVNTYHHQQWSASVPWERGYGLASHFDLLAVTVELGLVGGGLWLAIMGTVTAALVRAVRVSGRRDAEQGRVALAALLAWVTYLLIGLTVDSRFFDVTNVLVMFLAGAAIGRAARPSPVAVSG